MVMETRLLPYAPETDTQMEIQKKTLEHLL